MPHILTRSARHSMLAGFSAGPMPGPGMPGPMPGPMPGSAMGPGPGMQGPTIEAFVEVSPEVEPLFRKEQAPGFCVAAGSCFCTARSQVRLAALFPLQSEPLVLQSSCARMARAQLSDHQRGVSTCLLRPFFRHDDPRILSVLNCRIVQHPPTTL